MKKTLGFFTTCLIISSYTSILFAQQNSFVDKSLDKPKKTEGLNEKNDWKKRSQVEKQIDNIIFTFPASGYAYENRKKLVNECFEAMKYNCELINLEKFADTIYIRFLPNRKAMLPLTGSTPSGSALHYLKTFFAVANENERPPIKHELMHLIAMLEWYFEPPSSTWMNEGLATLAENNCSGWNVAQFYRYFLETDQLISIDLLTRDFRNQPENFSYHQSAYIVEYLLENYSIKQFKQVWKGGFRKFEEVYGLSFKQLKADLEKDLLLKMPKAPKIDPQTLYKNCE